MSHGRRSWLGPTGRPFGRCPRLRWAIQCPASAARTASRFDGRRQSSAASCNRSPERSLLAGDAVHQRVPVAHLGSARFEPGLEGRDRFREHLPEIFDAGKIADDAFDLGVVEQRRLRLVAHERAFPVGKIADQRVGGDMNDIGLDAQARRNRGAPGALRTNRRTTGSRPPRGRPSRQHRPSAG